MQSRPIGRPDAIVMRTYDTGMRKLEYILITAYAYTYTEQSLKTHSSSIACLRNGLFSAFLKCSFSPPHP